MKKFLMIACICASIITAQKIDTLKSVSKDSVNIRALVQKQIDDARTKKVESSVKPVMQAKIEVPVMKNLQPKETANSLVNYLMTQPVQYKIYEVVSLAIICFVLLRRVIGNWGRKSKKNLKIKIGLMREEKVGGTKMNPKLAKIRKVLKNNLEIFKQDDQQMAKTARQLNVSQGELLLAARLKLFEMKKM